MGEQGVISQAIAPRIAANLPTSPSTCCQTRMTRAFLHLKGYTASPPMYLAVTRAVSEAPISYLMKGLTRTFNC
jgi:hypothetical protein